MLTKLKIHFHAQRYYSSLRRRIGAGESDGAWGRKLMRRNTIRPKKKSGSIRAEPRTMTTTTCRPPKWFRTSDCKRRDYSHSWRLSGPQSLSVGEYEARLCGCPARSRRIRSSPLRNSIAHPDLFLFTRSESNLATAAARFTSNLPTDSMFDVRCRLCPWKLFSTTLIIVYSRILLHC